MSYDSIRNHSCFLQSRELGTVSRNDKWSVKTYLQKQLPRLLKEYPTDLCYCNFDKIFSSVWLDGDRLLFGSKCNQLTLYNTATRVLDDIPLIKSSTDSVPPEANGGIHSIAINPSQTLLATGGANCNDIGVYQLPDFQPLAICENGHDDWVFDIRWLDDEYFVAGSRDGFISLWCVREGACKRRSSNVVTIHPTFKRYMRLKGRESKVRCILRDPTTDNVVALLIHPDSFRRLVRLDINTMAKVKTPRVKETDLAETVSGCFHPYLRIFAYGSCDQVLLYDSSNLFQTNKKPLRDIQGVRSLSFSGDVLTIGGSMGELKFLDIRMNMFLPVDDDDANTWSDGSSSLHCSKGSVNRDSNFLNFFSYFNDYSTNAIFTHCYDPSGMKLFAGGGPLPSLLFGNYMGLWQ